jgi:hypothetical protein
MTDLRVHDHRSWRSRWVDVGVHDAPIFVFTMGRRQQQTVDGRVPGGHPKELDSSG